MTEAATRYVSIKKLFLKSTQNLEEHSCVGVSFLIKLWVSGLQLYLKTFRQVFSCEFCETFYNSFLNKPSGDCICLILIS